LTKILIDSAALVSILYEIEQGATMLGYITDPENIDDVDYYASRIQRAADDLRQLMKAAAPAKPPEISK
jgi:hypothetical protein